MLITIERFNTTNRTWEIEAHLSVDTALKIYSTQHGPHEVTRQLAENGVYRTQTIYETWEWDADLEEDFQVVTTYAVRFTPSKA